MLVETPCFCTDASVLYLGLALVHAIAFLQKVIAGEKFTALMDASLAALYLCLAITQHCDFRETMRSNCLSDNEDYHLYARMQGGH